MAWGMVDVDEQRMRFVVQASRGEKSLRGLCEEFKISRPTGYTWLRRFEAGGIAGVEEKSRRAHHSPTRTAADIEQRVLELRQQRPDWGARKLHALLEREGLMLPAITIHRILLRHHLVRSQDGRRCSGFRAVRRTNSGRWTLRGLWAVNH